jgi:magnesium chelatase subunit I
VIRRRDAFETDNARFMKKWRAQDTKLRKQILAARERVREIPAGASVLRDCAELCIALGSDGLRGELTLLKTARARAAFEGADEVTREHVKSVAPSALRHRLRRDPLDEAGSTIRVGRVLEEVFG